MNIAVFYGGRSYEHEISIITTVIMSTFFPREYTLIPVYMDNGELFIKKDFDRFSSYVKRKGDRKCTLVNGGIAVKGKMYKIACALITAHGGEGENGVLSSLMEYYSIPYTCCDPRASAICMDKLYTKYALRYHGFNVLPEDNSTFPCIIKPRMLGSSIGIKIAHNREELREFSNECGIFGNYITEPLLEDPIELNCSAVRLNGEVVVSSIESPKSKGEYLSFEEKYIEEGEKERIDLSDEILSEIKNTTLSIYKKLELFGVVRIDYLYKDKTLYVNEINAIPGSLAYYLFDSMTFVELIRGLIKEGIKRGVPESPEYSIGVIKSYAQGKSGNKLKGAKGN